MNVPEIALHHQRLAARMALLRAQIQRQQAELASDPEAEALERALEAATTARRDLELRLRDRDREVESHRGRLRTRERDLMSGRIKNPTELMKLDEEVRHLKTALSSEEDAELELMEEQERLESEAERLGRALEAVRARAAERAPTLRESIAGEEAELAARESEAAAMWEQLPGDWQTAFQRVEARVANPVAEVVGNQCQACHVAVTSKGMQVLRRAGLIQCDNCGRILVVA
jgi:predicted  nucleic acid-binding Zn-ribbon protein